MSALLNDAKQALSTSENLLACFYAPWDADDTRPLRMLKDVLDAQQRALVALLEAVEREQRISAGMRGRLNSVEAFR